jgi:addiction module RelE/StbE family toxin
MKLIWSVSASANRRAIRAYIAADNPGAAVRMDEVFSKAAAMLLEHPKLGKRGAIPGTREWLAHKSYRMVYEIDADTVRVLALVHTARQWPPVTPV